MNILWSLVLSLTLTFVEALDIAPKINRQQHHNDEDLIIENHQNFTLECVGDEPLKWTFPQVARDKQNWTKFFVSNSNDRSNKNYSSVLNIYNISYPFVGYYRCEYEEMNNEEKDQIYVYVNDSEHLSVEDNYKIQYAVQYQETTIPCRPTMPDIEVDLISYYGDDGIVKTNYKFHPKLGFTLTIPKLYFNGAFYCKFKSSFDINRTVELPFIVEIDPARKFLSKPYIDDQTHNHTEENQTLQLKCYLQETSTFIYFEWRTPRGKFKYDDGNNEDVIIESIKQKGPRLYSQLIVKNTQVEDSGLYECEVSDRQNHTEVTSVNVVVHHANECYINIHEENLQNLIEVKAGETAQWIVNILAHPIPQLFWFDNKGNPIKNGSGFRTFSLSGETAKFRIENVGLENVGNYKIRGVSSKDFSTSSCPSTAEYNLELKVLDKPSICLKSSPKKPCKNFNHGSSLPEFFKINDLTYLECIAKGNPLPQITWDTHKCVNTKCTLYEVDPLSVKDLNTLEPFSTKSQFQVDTTKDGIVRCSAINNLGINNVAISYYVSDVKHGFDTMDFNPTTIITENSNLTTAIVAKNDIFTFTCAISSKKAEFMKIYFNQEALSSKHDKNTVASDLSIKTTITLRNTHPNDSGVYTCKIKNLYDQNYEYRYIQLEVQEPQRPEIISTNMESEFWLEYPKMQLELRCFATGLPKPYIKWYWNDQLIIPQSQNDEDDDNLFLEKDNQILLIKSVEEINEGKYKCEVINSEGVAVKETDVRISNKPVSVVIYYCSTGFVFILLIIALIYIIIKIRKEKEFRRKLRKLGLENFDKGNPENLNPDLGIDDQAELLPYNRKFEFPIEHLKLGKQLGSGAFGIVLKGEAKSLVPGEPKTTVAVKMVKKNADDSYIKALASELKIMVHLGQHINVVNLLGACTKNVANRELLVMVEFCRFGNLQNFIYKHRTTYINQVDAITGIVDYQIGADLLLERAYSISSSEKCNSPSYSINTTTSRDYSGQLSYTGDESVILSNNSTVQPEWRLNYRGDYKGEVKPISTRDLLTWSFQVSRGMEYLASRKVLHGDLAARNILLADNNIVKICDFGLAKTMYNDNNYKKKSNNPLPIKWMAIESIRDRIFSTQSDIWSFGIVLWEFFSLAKTPYPGMEADERLYHKLVEGYRMESPSCAPKEVYKIMLDCWAIKPQTRPSFTKLAEKIGNLLEDTVRQHYVDLNDPYLRMNTEKRQEDDYLDMLSPPTFEILSSPSDHYSNNEELMFSRQENNSENPPEGYMAMRPNQIFSPRNNPSNNLFKFPSSGNSTILCQVNDTDEEMEKTTGYLMPVTPVDCVSNPLYHQISNNKANNIIRTKDNYIAMPNHQYKNLRDRTNSRDSGNGSPVQLDTDKENVQVYYVNSPPHHHQHRPNEWTSS